MSIAQRILNNTIYGAAGRFWLIGVNLFLTPFILSYLGDEKFALWALFWAVSAYFMLMDMGLGVAVVRKIAQLHEMQNPREMSQVVVTALLVTLGIGLAIWLVSFAVFVVFFEHLVQASIYADEIYTLITWGFPILILISLTRVFDAFIKGFQRFDMITGITFATSLVNVLTVYIALEQDMEIAGLMFANMFTYAFQLLGLYVLSKRCESSLSLWPNLFSFNCLKEMLPLGARIQVAKVAELASYQADKFILAYFLPLSFVTFYDLGSKIASLMRDATYVFTTAIFPVAAQMQARGEEQQLWYLYERGSKYLVMFTIPALALILITAPMLIGAWLGHVSEFVLQAVMVLAVAYWVVVNMSMAFNMGTALNWSKPIMRGAILQTILNITLSILLISQWGFVGALWGTLIAISLSKLYVFLSFYRDFNRAMLPDIKLFMRVLLVNAPAVLLTLGFMAWVEGGFTVEGRLSYLTAWMAMSVFYVVVYLLSIRWMKLFDAYDYNLLNKRIPMIRYLIHQTFRQ